MDDGVVLNSTDLGGAPWPKCVKGCDANSRARCSAANPECVMDSARTTYVAPVPQRIGTISIAATATRAASGAVVRIFTKGHTAKVGLGDVLSDSTRNVSLAALAAGGARPRRAGGHRGRRRHEEDVLDRRRPDRPGRVRRGLHASDGSRDRRIRVVRGDDALTVRAGTDPTVRDLTVIPALDLAAPSFATSFPRVSSPASATIEMAVQLSEPGVVYYLVVPDGTRAPTSREVKEALELRTADLMVSSAVVAGNITSLKSLTSETVATVDSIVAAGAGVRRVVRRRGRRRGLRAEREAESAGDAVQARHHHRELVRGRCRGGP